MDQINQINEEAELTALDLIPRKSADNYIRSYNKFMQWKKEKNVNEDCFSEAVMLEYFNNMTSKRVYH